MGRFAKIHGAFAGKRGRGRAGELDGRLEEAAETSSDDLVVDYRALLRDGVVPFAGRHLWGQSGPDDWFASLETAAAADGLRASGFWLNDDDIAFLAVVELVSPKGAPYDSTTEFPYGHPPPLEPKIAALRPQIERDWGETLERARRRHAI